MQPLMAGARSQSADSPSFAATNTPTTTPLTPKKSPPAVTTPTDPQHEPPLLRPPFLPSQASNGSTPAIKSTPGARRPDPLQGRQNAPAPAKQPSHSPRHNPALGIRPVSSHLLANLYLFFSGRLLAEQNRYRLARSGAHPSEL